MELSLTVIGVLGFAFLFGLMFIGVPIGLSFALAGFVGTCAIIGFGPGVSLLGRIPYSSVASYILSVMILFMLMGEFATIGGLTERGYNFAHKWFGHLPGGLAITNLVACVLFGAISGSAVATAMIMTQASWPEMKRFNYSPELGLGSIAAAAIIAILIPPSIPLILYGIIAGESIGKLFVAGILPGLLLSVLLGIIIYIWCKIKPSIAPPSPKSSWKERLIGLKGIWEIFVIALIVIGGIWGGIFTPNEAAGVGCVFTLIVALIKRGTSWKQIIAHTREIALMGSSMFLLFIGVAIFNSFMALTELPQNSAAWVGTLPLSPMTILWIILLIYFLLGFFMDAPPVLLLTVSLFVPIIETLGFDKVWFGILTVLVVSLGALTPPVGMNVFVISARVPDVPIYTVFKGVMPFLLGAIATVAILVYVPQIVMYLPNILYAK